MHTLNVERRMYIFTCYTILCLQYMHTNIIIQLVLYHDTSQHSRGYITVQDSLSYVTYWAIFQGILFKRSCLYIYKSL